MCGSTETCFHDPCCDDIESDAHGGLGAPRMGGRAVAFAVLGNSAIECPEPDHRFAGTYDTVDAWNGPMLFVWPLFTTDDGSCRIGGYGLERRPLQPGGQFRERRVRRPTSSVPPVRGMIRLPATTTTRQRATAVTTATAHDSLALNYNAFARNTRHPSVPIPYTVARLRTPSTSTRWRPCRRRQSAYRRAVHRPTAENFDPGREHGQWPLLGFHPAAIPMRSITTTILGDATCTYPLVGCMDSNALNYVK